MKPRKRYVMAKKNPKQSNPSNQVFSILKTEEFRLVIKALEHEHPVHVGLPASASLEQRALHQCRTQEYESVLQKLIKWSVDAKASSIESTYESQKGT